MGDGRTGAGHKPFWTVMHFDPVVIAQCLVHHGVKTT